ncbi:Holliday junction resolvase RuvX [Marinomonas sp. 15G1-11]|uniref:Putative pre-16S rRNA nuclease n=1 Tax=Marinomonas phaeophyticola TaxID=3004091 RepID=A0ABT4JWK8_9GAMM|nr:Holliday junction resolvase RuvX [Marinomonas sp. 15G1-11]MCZ2722626.1 Holliday junction resolvase RuvX [Marinomonas sp. 15G1-11]
MVHSETENTGISVESKTLLGFDFGTTRIGVAVGQTWLGTATPLDPIKAKEGIPNWDVIEALVAEWQPDGFVVGLPLNMDGSENEMCLRAKKFANRLQGRFGKPRYLMDERLSSYEAKGMVIESGGSRNFKENSVDGIAAQMILTSWFGESANTL